MCAEYYSLWYMRQPMCMLCLQARSYTLYWESFMEENIRDFRGFWNDCECFLVTIFYLVIILTKNVCC